MRHRYTDRVGNPRYQPGLVHTRLVVTAVAVCIAIAQRATTVIARAIGGTPRDDDTRIFAACGEIRNIREPAESRYRRNPVAVCAELAVDVFAPTEHAPRRVDAARVIFTHFDAAQRCQCSDLCRGRHICTRYGRDAELTGVAPPTIKRPGTHFGTRRIIAHFNLSGRQ